MMNHIKDTFQKWIAEMKSMDVSDDYKEGYKSGWKAAIKQYNILVEGWNPIMLKRIEEAIPKRKN
jgi:hypothetical protein